MQLPMASVQPALSTERDSAGESEIFQEKKVVNEKADMIDNLVDISVYDMISILNLLQLKYQYMAINMGVDCETRKIFNLTLRHQMFRRIRRPLYRIRF
ncbi:hypothetical protein Lalb_Chr03g0031521 [Lupinus albus]|uniref:Uncharacterized protein n=1 Tax=Lupinus albus TaxID=3870 RepID=A0A6A4QUG8_LUPAL|nr:hypothetical protein Lalb_Chr03g0031521 [Lupinus albus]